jgi:SAM-dependent methyltransferase
MTNPEKVTMEHICCDLCGSANSSLLMRRADRFSGETFCYVICRDCGLIYLNPRPNQEEILAYYPEEYESYQTSGSLERIARWRRQHALAILRQFVEKHKRPGSLLDIGCAHGEFLVEMRSHGWTVEGIEINKYAATIAQEKYGLNIFIGTLNEFDGSGRYDVITMWDVLEHLASPKLALRRIHHLLNPDGRIIFCIPNLRSFDAKLFGHWWTGWDPPRHLFMFPPRVLDALLCQVGFEVETRRCILGGVGAFMLSCQFWLDNTIESNTAFKERLKQVCDSLVPYLLWPYKEISYALDRGPIVTIVARKGIRN